MLLSIQMYQTALHKTDGATTVNWLAVSTSTLEEMVFYSVTTNIPSVPRVVTGICATTE